ncbi:MAG: hypothetical protein JO112_06385 [Planctomycetes bacterium]|nr:hypothetical protein [Planctomycetota bacterium]
MNLPWALPTFDLNLLLLKWLAVLGGGALGAFGTGTLIKVLGKFVTSKNVPRPVVNVLRGLGGVVLGWAVWLWAFGTGGPGWFPGAGWPGGSGGGQPGNQEVLTQSTSKEKSPATQASSTNPDQGQVLHVVVLGGERVREERVYQVEGEDRPRTLAELKKFVKAHQAQDPFTTMDLVFYENSNTRANLPLADLEEWARENHLTVTLSSRSGDVP